MSDSHLRQQLRNMLVRRQAHMTFEEAVQNFPMAHINSKPPHVSYSFWHLLEHIRFCQRDILEYIENPHYQAHEWPRDYWRPQDEQTDEAGWQQTIEAFYADRSRLVALLDDPTTDLFAAIPHGWDGHTILREMMVVASHNAYHIGEFAILRQVMGLW